MVNSFIACGRGQKFGTVGGGVKGYKSPKIFSTNVYTLLAWRRPNIFNSLLLFYPHSHLYEKYY